MIIFICARTDNQIPPHEHAITPNARLNHRRSPQNLFCARVKLHEHRPREVVSMFRLVMSESAKAREEREAVFDTEPRVPSIPAKRSHIKTKISHRTPTETVNTSPRNNQHKSPETAAAPLFPSLRSIFPLFACFLPVQILFFVLTYFGRGGIINSPSCLSRTGMALSRVPFSRSPLSRSGVWRNYLHIILSGGRP